MAYALRYAPHLGYFPPDRLMFSAHAGSDPVDHVHFAATEGMAGVLDPWVADRPAEQRRAIKAALEETGLACGCIVSTPFAKIMDPLWLGDGTEAELLGCLQQALDVAGDMGSTKIAVLLPGDGSADRDVQWRRAIDRLRAGADLAARQGATVVVEPIKGLPGTILRSFAEAVQLVRETAHPNVKLIFDSGHVYDMGEPILETYVEAYDEIGVLQLADMPGRVEVGGGEIDFVPLLAHALSRGYAGLVELEHDWTEPGREGERRSIDRLRAIDAQARLNAAQALAAPDACIPPSGKQ